MAYETRAWSPSRILTRISTEEGERIERRRSVRIKMELAARYLTPEGEEYNCVTVDFSPAGVRFRAPQLPSLGADIIAYVSDLGRIQGNVIRRTKDGFVVAVVGTSRKTERLAQKIAWLQPNDVQDRRLFSRLTLEGALISLTCADGRTEVAPIVDVSETGIAFRTELDLKVGDKVVIGEQSGIIVRLFAGGAAAKFV